MSLLFSVGVSMTGTLLVLAQALQPPAVEDAYVDSVDVTVVGQFVLLAGVLKLSFFSVCHFTVHALYESSKAWQVSILTAHASPLVVLRMSFHAVNAHSGSLVIIGVAWIFVLHAVRHEIAKTTSPYCAVILVLEVAMLVAPLSHRYIAMLMLMNIVIPVVFWSYIILAVVFTNMDPMSEVGTYLRKGVKHVFITPRALYSVLADILVHGALQICVASFLWPDVQRINRSTACDLLATLSVYWVVVCITSWAIGCDSPYPGCGQTGLMVCILYWVCSIAWWCCQTFKLV